MFEPISDQEGLTPSSRLAGLYQVTVRDSASPNRPILPTFRDRDAGAEVRRHARGGFAYGQIASILAVLIFAAGVETALADVGPPVRIKMSPDTRAATSGAEYTGVFHIHVDRGGTLSDFQLVGQGWSIISLEVPGESVAAQPGLLTLPFRARPTDADQPITLSLTYDGWSVSRSFEVGPAYFDRVSKPRALRRVPTVAEPLEPKGVSELGDQSPPGDRRGSSVQVTGRLVYTRAGRDMNGDGDMDDPDDIQPVTVGADNIWVRVWDEDLVGSSLIWEGFTDNDGYFDTGFAETDDPEPDLYVLFECESGVGAVEESGPLEINYSWETEVIEDFQGTVYEFGTQTPTDPTDMPALHLWNSLVRTHRFIETRAGLDAPSVDVLWPDGETGAFYDGGEIHISSERSWRNDTLSHEYGHHFLTNFSITIPTDYCNDNNFCDGEDSCTSGTDCEDPGHCIWCPETDHDAWNEGFPNWLADTVTRSYPEDYVFDDGTEYEALYTRDLEDLSVCCQDSMMHDPLITEGFIGALLRDIEDDTQDDHDNDGIRDTLCLGVDEIFNVVVTYFPITPELFIAWFRYAYPEYSDELWPTAFNVAPAFVAGYPADVDPPGVVEVCDSPSHPLGVGGPLPCIIVEWEPASDDVSGACGYSFEWGTIPLDPDEIEDPISFNDCLWSTSTLQDLGQYYFSIKALDCAGNWGAATTFGPFEVIDCNDSGVLDGCDIKCIFPGVPGVCIFPESLCASCETSEDCNTNYFPDECDIASGTSQDCNENLIPDECENMLHWAGGVGSWHYPSSWEEEQVPDESTQVCIFTGDATVQFTSNTTTVPVVACHDNLSMSSTGAPWPELTIEEPSFVNGELSISGLWTKLTVPTSLEIGGLFDWFGASGAKIDGGGVVTASGSMILSGNPELSATTLVNKGSATSTAWMLLSSDAVFLNDPSGSFDFQSDGTFFGGSTGTLDNRGSIIRSAGDGDAWIDVFTDNSGEIRVMSGTLALTRGSSSTGNFVGDPGTILTFGAGGHELLGDSSIAAEYVHFASTAGDVNIRGTYDVSGTTLINMFYVNFTPEATILDYGDTLAVPSGVVNFDTVVGSAIEFASISLGSSYSGTANFNSGDPIITDTLTIGPGTITGPSPITVNELLTWRAGGHFHGPGVVNANGGLLV